MLALRELQSAMRRALLGGDPGPLRSAIASDGIDPDARLDIYRHHVFTTLTAVLEGAYPVVCRLVDPRFFGYAADQYIRSHPPVGACLDEYGASFADFVATFPSCGNLGYLPDVARLEWAISRARLAGAAEPLDPMRLSAVSAARMPALTFSLDPSLSLLASEWPVDRIWRANQPDADKPAVDLDAGRVRLEIRRVDGEPVWRTLDPATFALRRALADGRTLADAATAAVAIDEGLDLAAALRELLEDRILIDFAVPRPEDRSRR